MIHPVYGLLMAILAFGATVVLFWPQNGFFWRWQRLRKMTERVLIEDALKHLYNCEYHKQTPTVESLSGALEISGNRAADVLIRMQGLKLVKSEGSGLRLTPEGRQYALRIIRVHRLWEHYLAEKTGVAETAWHSEAERREHDMSPEEIEHLDRQMGYPVFDPHGDPIPTASGSIAPRRGQPLTALSEGDSATIVHIEDEPEAVYAQLVTEGIHRGMHIEVVEVSPQRVQFWGDGEEYVLAPVVAANISAVVLRDRKDAAETGEPLSVLNPGEKAKVIRIARNCRGLERRRLMDLGILPGTAIEVEMRSPSGDPTAYRVRGAMIALRKEQANQIHIARQTEAA